MNMFQPLQLKDVILIFGIERYNMNGFSFGIEDEVWEAGLFLTGDYETVAVGGALALYGEGFGLLFEHFSEWMDKK